MARTTRLLELLLRVQSIPHFTAGQMATEFGVSRRTMLRDLQALSEMGVPLAAMPGPGGGYSMMRSNRRLPLYLTVDEALAMLISYEAFLRYAQSPFAEGSMSAVTKLRAALPPDVTTELDRVREHLAVFTPPRRYAAPLLGDLLQAALDRAHLRIAYDSRSGASRRVIFPFGLLASEGFWYCACHDYTRDTEVSLRADRILSLERVAGYETPAHVPVGNFVEFRRRGGTGLPLRIRVTPRGMKNFNLESLFGQIVPTRRGGLIEGEIPQSEVEWYAAQLLPVGVDAVVESPPDLIAAIQRQADSLATLYGGGAGRQL